MRFSISCLLLLSCSRAFVPCPRVPTRRCWLLATSPQQEEVEAIRDEIAELKAEAQRRMDVLKSQLSNVTDTTYDDTSVSNESSTTGTAISNHAPRKEASSARSRDSLSLLENTRWKVMLNIGREQGTWMPKTWGVSGERLLLNAEIDFLPDQLYDREEFLNGIANAKQLRVHHLSLGPTIKEGSRDVSVKELGGWRVAPGEGPMGTDLLRFYIEIEEEVRHSGGDVYCPRGRVYCTCGYFPMKRATGVRDLLREEQERLSRQHDDLSQEMETASVWDKLKIGKQLMDVRMELGRVSRELNEARVREPERELLRLSQDQSVGLTKEGGVCCKVTKGLAVEFHILGKFGVASVEKREDAEDDTLLP